MNAAQRLSVGLAGPSGGPATSSPAVSTTGRARRVAPSAGQNGAPAASVSSAYSSMPFLMRLYRGAEAAPKACDRHGPWTYRFDPEVGRTVKVCDWCGGTQPREDAAVAVDTSVLVTQPVWVIVDRRASDDSTRAALLAGPFWTAASAAEATSEHYRYTDAEPLRHRVDPGDFRTLARGGPPAAELLFCLIGAGCGRTREVSA